MFMKKCLIVFCAALLMMLQCCIAGASELKEDPEMLLTAERTWDIRKAQYTLFAKPPVGWVGDVMPMGGDEESGELRLFYLQDWRDGAPTYHPFHSFTTSDFVHYTYNGEDIPVTATNHYDMALGTGSVTKVGDTYHAFYTGNNPHFFDQGSPASTSVMQSARMVCSPLSKWRTRPSPWIRKMATTALTSAIPSCSGTRRDRSGGC